MQHRSPRRRLILTLGALGSLPLLLLPALGLASAATLWLLPFAWAAAYGLARSLTRPLEELQEMALRLQEGDLQARAFLEPGSDWAPVARVMGDLAERLDLVTRTLEQQVEERTSALTRKADQLRAVGQVGQQVAAVLEPEALLHFVVRVMRGTFGYDVVAFLQRHGEHLVLTAGAARGIEEVPLGRAFSLARYTEPHGTGPGALIGGLSVQSELAVPTRLGDRLLGVLVIQSVKPQAFDPEDHFTVSTIAGQVAVALENARLLEAERQLRQLSITEERNRMAREIHDTLAQGFMGIIMQLRAMQTASDPEMARFHREQAESLAQESLQEARRSVWNLRPRPLEEKGLEGALASELESLERRAAISTALTVEGDIDRLSAPVQAALLRIAQEALHNTMKYARAGHVTLHLSVEGEQATLTVSDDGVGFDPGALRPKAGGGGFGLSGMAERARLLGGSLGIDSEPGAGCRIAARVPLGRQ